MSLKSFNKLLSPLVTKNLYKYQLYNYIKDQEVIHSNKIENVLDMNKEKQKE